MKRSKIAKYTRIDYLKLCASPVAVLILPLLAVVPSVFSDIGIENTIENMKNSNSLHIIIALFILYFVCYVNPLYLIDFILKNADDDTITIVKEVKASKGILVAKDEPFRKFKVFSERKQKVIKVKAHLIQLEKAGFKSGQTRYSNETYVLGSPIINNTYKVKYLKLSKWLVIE